MKYDEFKEMCRVDLSKKFNYLCIDMSKNKDVNKYRIFNESKNTYIENFPKVNLFKVYEKKTFTNILSIREDLAL